MLERAHGGLEKVDDILVLLVLRAVAGHIEGGCAGRVLGELVAPEVRVWPALIDPILVHLRRRTLGASCSCKQKVRTVIQELEATKLHDKRLDGRPFVRWNDRAVVKFGRRGTRVKLAGEVAVLLVAAVAIIWPETV